MMVEMVVVQMHSVWQDIGAGGRFVRVWFGFRLLYALLCSFVVLQSDMPDCGLLSDVGLFIEMMVRSYIVWLPYLIPRGYKAGVNSTHAFHLLQEPFVVRRISPNPAQDLLPQGAVLIPPWLRQESGGGGGDGVFVCGIHTPVHLPGCRVTRWDSGGVQGRPPFCGVGNSKRHVLEAIGY